MAFTIDPDFSFQKVGTSAGRKDRGAAPSDTGATFARTLMRAGENRDSTPAQDAGGKDAVSDQPVTIVPLLHPESQATPAPAPEGDEISLTAATSDGTAENAAETPDADDSSSDALAVEAEALAHAPAQPASSDNEDTAQSGSSEFPAGTGPEAALESEILTEQTQSASPTAEQHPAHQKTAKANDHDLNDAPQPEVQAAVAGIVVPVAKPAGAREATKAASDIASIGSASTTASAPVPNQPEAGKPALKTAELSDAGFDLAMTDELASAEKAASKSTGTHDVGKAAETNGTTPAPDAALMGAAQPASAAQSAPAPAASAMTATHGVMVASPAETVRIITDSIETADDRKDQITIQLDPPELGRVSIDFKFDSRGLQHVTITGDNPEALRQLRLMHFELTQALERNGLSSENMTFQQQSHPGHQQQNSQPGPAARTFNTAISADDPASTSSASLQQPARPARVAGSGLDIRV